MFGLRRRRQRWTRGAAVNLVSIGGGGGWWQRRQGWWGACCCDWIDSNCTQQGIDTPDRKRVVTAGLGEEDVFFEGGEEDVGWVVDEGWWKP